MTADPRALPYVLSPGPEEPERHPVLGYLLIISAWLASISALWASGRTLPTTALELALLALAAHQLSRVVAKEKIAYPLRRLFTYEDGETPREGWRKAPGQLVTCPYCASVWAATGLLALQLEPLTLVLAFGAVSSLAHAWRDRG